MLVSRNYRGILYPMNKKGKLAKKKHAKKAGKKASRRYR
jgi:hypothetical protein